MPFAGHVGPVAAVAGRLVELGHDVVAYTGSRYTARFERIGATTISWNCAPDFDEHNLPATFPELGRSGPAGLLANVEHLFIRTAVGQALDLVTAHAEHPYDLIAGDVMALGTGMAAELLSIPWATISVVPLSLPSIDLPPTGFALPPGSGGLSRARNAALRAVVRIGSTRLEHAHRDVRRTLGLPATRKPVGEAWYSPWLVMATGSPGIEFPRSDLGRQFHFVGRLATPTAVSSYPDWWGELETTTSPAVLVTQGTFNIDPSNLIEPSLAALADRDVLVTATTAGAALKPGAVPTNARIADFLPYSELLPRLDAVVSNGGWGGVLEFLAEGLPLVIAGADLDKPEIAARVAWSGAGLDLRTGKPSIAAIRAAYDRVVADPGFRSRARRLAAELAALGGVDRAAELLQQLLTTGKPVQNDGNPWGLQPRR